MILYQIINLELIKQFIHGYLPIVQNLNKMNQQNQCIENKSSTEKNKLPNYRLAVIQIDTLIKIETHELDYSFMITIVSYKLIK